MKEGAVMLKVLGRKQNSTNADWLAAVADIERIISAEEVEQFAAKAIDDIRVATAGKKAAYGWSGGKDSIVLGKLCESAGVTRSFFGHCDLEFQSFLSWALSNMPENCLEITTPIGLRWLSEHPEMLFIDDAKRLNRWLNCPSLYGQYKNRPCVRLFDLSGVAQR